MSGERLSTAGIIETVGGAVAFVAGLAVERIFHVDAAPAVGLLVGAGLFADGARRSGREDGSSDDVAPIMEYCRVENP